MERNLILLLIEHGLINEIITIQSAQKFLQEKYDKNFKLLRAYKDMFFTISIGQVTPNTLFYRVEDRPPAAEKLDITIHWKYRVLPQALFQYLDYQELIEVRKTAKQARNLAWIAIAFALVVGMGQILISIYL